MNLEKLLDELDSLTDRYLIMSDGTNCKKTVTVKEKGVDDDSIIQREYTNLYNGLLTIISELKQRKRENDN